MHYQRYKTLHYILYLFKATEIPFGSDLLNRTYLDFTTLATKYAMIVIPGAVRVSAPRPGPHPDPGLCPDPRWHLPTVHGHDQRSRVRTTIQG